MEQIRCIFCDRSNKDVAITENGFTGVTCHECRLIYISPRPSADAVENIYTDEHAVLYADAQFQFDAFNRMEAARTVEKIRSLKEKGTLLELGPGGGCFLAEARGAGYEPYGIELNPIEAGWINQTLRIPCESQDLSETSFDGKKFDIIYHRDVLSHLPNPIESFQAMNRALNNDGLLIFETGNIADVKKKYLKYFSQFSYPDHLFFFGERSLNLLLQRSGFEILRIEREPIILQLVLQKALWWIKDSLKDKNVATDLRSKHRDKEPERLTVKRRLRLLYRYVRHYLVRLSAPLPKKGRPLKLVITAKKATPA